MPKKLNVPKKHLFATQYVQKIASWSFVQINPQTCPLCIVERRSSLTYICLKSNPRWPPLAAAGRAGLRLSHTRVMTAVASPRVGEAPGVTRVTPCHVTPRGAP